MAQMRQLQRKINLIRHAASRGEEPAREYILIQMLEVLAQFAAPNKTRRMKREHICMQFHGHHTTPFVHSGEREREH